MKSRLFGCLAIVVVLALIGSVLLNVFLVFSSADLDVAGSGLGQGGPHALRESAVQGSVGKGVADRVAQIDVEGVIVGDGIGLGSMVEGLKRSLRQATNDPSVKAIVLRINSPGGEVTASDTIYKAVKDADSKKPVIAYMDSVAASGGYYIACGARRIVANPTTLTGSIGVIMQGFGADDLMAKVGVESRTFKSGKMKDAGSMSRDMTDEEKAYFQNLVMQNYERFVGIVSKARGIAVDELKTGVADGRVFIGEEALAKKLVDANGYIEDAYAMAYNEAGISDARIFRYAQPPSFLNVLSVLGQAQTEPKKIEIELNSALLPKLKPGLPYFLPSAWTP
jgi:protease IV